MSSSLRPLCSVVAFGIVAAAAPAFAQPNHVPHSVGNDVMVVAHENGHETKHKAVQYVDLNLNTAAGVKTLLTRLQNAAERVCGPRPSRAGELQARQHYDACMKDAMDGAVAAVGSPLLQQAYDASKPQG